MDQQKNKKSEPGVKKQLRRVVALLFLGAVAVMIGLGCYAHSRRVALVWVKGKLFKSEIAATPSARELGLSGRDSLCASCAMVFKFDRSGDYSFWMKDMKFDLDILWADGGRIVAIEKNASHERGTSVVLDPHVRADTVVEVGAGLAGALGIKIGDALNVLSL